jgi:hypothetical protein
MEYYVVWRNKDGGIESGEITMEDEITSVAVVIDAVLNKLGYWKQQDFSMIISWQPLNKTYI